MIAARVLPPDEWARLDDTSMRDLWRDFAPTIDVLVVERDGRIVASVALLPVLHAECLEVAGGPGVRRALWSLLCARVRARSTQSVWGAAVDDTMYALLMRHGSAIPGDHFLVRV